MGKLIERGTFTQQERYYDGLVKGLETSTELKDRLAKKLDAFPPDVHGTLMAGAIDLFPYYRGGPMSDDQRNIVAGILPDVAEHILTGAGCLIPNIPEEELNKYDKLDDTGRIVYLKPEASENGNAKKPRS